MVETFPLEIEFVANEWPMKIGPKEGPIVMVSNIRAALIRLEVH